MLPVSFTQAGGSATPPEADPRGRPRGRRRGSSRAKWDADYYARKQKCLLDAPAPELDARPFSMTKTGKKRKDTEQAYASAKKRAIATVGNALVSLGDAAQQSQALRAYSESAAGKPIAMAAGYHLEEDVETAVYCQGQVHTHIDICMHFPSPCSSHE